MSRQPFRQAHPLPVRPSKPPTWEHQRRYRVARLTFVLLAVGYLAAHVAWAIIDGRLP